MFIFLWETEMEAAVHRHLPVLWVRMWNTEGTSAALRVRSLPSASSQGKAAAFTNPRTLDAHTPGQAKQPAQL